MSLKCRNCDAEDTFEVYTFQWEVDSEDSEVADSNQKKMEDLYRCCECGMAAPQSEFEVEEDE